jgi:hypothetical protein
MMVKSTPSCLGGYAGALVLTNDHAASEIAKHAAGSFIGAGHVAPHECRLALVHDLIKYSAAW